jgi:hypothetical protein
VSTYTTYAVADLLFLGYLKVTEHRAVILAKNKMRDSNRFTMV